MRFILGLFVIAFSVPAHADWHVAESDNFVIYADDQAKDLQAFGEALESYNAALNLLSKREATKPSPSNRLTIFVVGSQNEIGKLADDKSKTIAGFYIPRAGSSVAFVPDIRMRGRETDWSMTVLLHEYAHHYFISNTTIAMPRWVDEGAAEFFASAKFERDGGLSIGRPARHRAAELAYARDVSVEELVDPKLYSVVRGLEFPLCVRALLSWAG